MGRERVEEMLEAFERSLEAGGIRSHGAYLVKLRAFLSFADAAGAGRTWADLTQAAADEWTRALLESGQARRTVNNKLAVLRRWGRWLVKTGRVMENPFRDLPALRVGPWLPKKILGIEETGVFLSSFRLRSPMDVMVKAILELLYGSGVRISEAVSMKEADLDRPGRMVKVFESKAGKERRVPVTEAFLSALDLYYAEARDALVSDADREAGLVFPSRGGTTIRVRVNAILDRETSRLGLERITSHSMRHMAATHMLRKGAGIRQVQAFLGHERIGTTQGYTRVCVEDLKRVIETCHPAEGCHVE